MLTQTTGEEIGSTRMLAFAIACAIAMFLLLQAALRSWRLAALVTASLPVALVGGAVAALIVGAELTLGAATGFLALFGLAARNGLVLFRCLQDGGNARERLTPVAAASLAVAVVALPFVVMGSRPGLEVVHPMAVVVLGGVITTALTALFLLPALYATAGAARAPSLTPDEEILFRPAGVEHERV